MGWLRKIGRKAKKGIKKLFSSKIGAFVGSIALSMIMGPVISKAFNGIKGVFTGAAQKGTETLVQEGVQKVVEEKAADVATKGIVDNTVGGVMEKVVADNALSNDLLLQAQEGLKGNLQESLKSSVTTTMDIAKDGSKLLKDLSTEEGYNAAKRCGLSIISQIKKACGDDLSKIKSCIKLTGFVNSTDDFIEQPKVINGASDLIASVFGEAGMHTRAAVSTNSLPLGVSVEVDAIFELN